MKTASLIASLLVVLSPIVAQAQTPPPPAPREPAMLETISVSGVGKSRVAPDRVSFTAGVETMAPTVDDAIRENNTKVAAVIAALKKAGATDAEIRTSSFAIFPQQDYREGQRPRITGYQVSNNVTVTREKTADAGRLLQAAVNAGANAAGGLTFFVNDPSRGREEGLRKAYADARSKAEVLAAAAGRSVGAAISITEGGAPAVMYPRPAMERAMVGQAQGAVMNVPVQEGTEELSFVVSVIFQLR